MSRSLVYGLLIGAVVFGGVDTAVRAEEATAGVQRSAVDGAWRMVSRKQGDAAKYEKISDGRERLKTVTAGRFLNVLVEDGMVIRSAGGTCQLYRGTQDDRYIETVQFVSDEGAKWFVGPEQIYKSTLKGDRWRIEGLLKGDSGKFYRIAETWKRVKR